MDNVHQGWQIQNLQHEYSYRLQSHHEVAQPARASNTLTRMLPEMKIANFMPK